MLGVVGESGSGKSTLAYQMLGYSQANARIASGTVSFLGTDIATLDRNSLQELRGNRISFVPQNPTTALNPAMTVKAQIAEVLSRHMKMDRTSIAARFTTLMDQVGLGKVEGIADRFPHRLSGGQQQRIAIAMALACKPSLVILDEPTTGLDVTVQQQIIGLLKSLRAGGGVSMVYVTHDLPLLRQLADRLAVMYKGELVEIGDAAQVFSRPQHPYSKALLASVPIFQAAELSVGKQVNSDPPLLEARNVEISFGARRGIAGIGRTRGFRAVPNVTLSIGEDETVALIGESGSGKSTIARTICGLIRPVGGAIRFRGENIAPLVAGRTVQQRREIQYIFQNPDASLNPRMRVSEILARPLGVFFSSAGGRMRDKVTRALADVHLGPAYLDRYPHELSGGERQRVAIARALLAEPSLLLCDEVLSALDVSVQARVLDLLKELRAKTGVSMLFISHDLGVVRSIADRVGVLYRGELVEFGATEAIYTAPQHAYTKKLLAAAIAPTALGAA